MRFLACIKMKNTSNVLVCGNALQLLTMTTVVYKAVSARIAKEKGICKEEAEKLVIESLKDTKELLR